MNELDGLKLVEPSAYAEHGYPHDVWNELRANDPLHQFDVPGWRPFWAVTKHADIIEISKQPEKFTNHPRMVISPLEQELEAERAQAEGGFMSAMRTIIQIDGEDHRKLRKVAAHAFTPNVLKRLKPVIDATAKDLIDEMAARGECDFITDVANIHPLKIICRILGMPESDEPLILRLTNELFGSADPEFQRDPDRQKRMMELGVEMFQFFTGIIEDRRANPTDDLASVIANATVDGEPMSPGDTLGYFLITFTAGHETTRGGIGGGLRALIENQDQIASWKADLSIEKQAVNEIIRYVTPVNTMVRTAAVDYELRGKTIKAGDALVLFYASANRDEEVFEDPHSFRVDRKKNPHLGFGIGEHFCIGSNLARMTTGALYSELVPRIESIELAGEPQHVASNLVPGLKHLPVRYQISESKTAVRS
jgi:hypothetical protein